MSAGGIILTICINLIIIYTFYIFLKRDIDRRLKHVKTEIQELEDLVSAIIAEFEAIAAEVDPDSVRAGAAEKAAVDEGVTDVREDDQEAVTERIIAEVEAALANPGATAAFNQNSPEPLGSDEPLGSGESIGSGGESAENQEFQAEPGGLEPARLRNSSSNAIQVPEELQGSVEEPLSGLTDGSEPLSSKRKGETNALGAAADSQQAVTGLKPQGTVAGQDMSSSPIAHGHDLKAPHDESAPQPPLTFSGTDPAAPSQPVISDPRRRRVYELWRRGLTVEEIAKELGAGRGEIQLLLYQWTVKRQL